MVWYYKEGDQESGPVNKEELQELIRAKRVNASTLVRSKDSDQWRPLAEYVKKKRPPTPSDQAVKEAPGQSTAPSAPQAPSTAVCSQCGRSFPQDQVIRFEDQIICAACKPLFVQKLKEGAEMPSTHRYAGFWIRVAAKIIDWIILSIVQWAILIPLNLLVFSSVTLDPEQPPAFGAFMGVMGMQTVLGILIPMIYVTFFLGRFGATPGKMACRIKVIAPGGEPISYLRAFGRFWGEIVSAMVLLIGYLMVAFDSQKRALHDRICSTRVVYK